MSGLDMRDVSYDYFLPSMLAARTVRAVVCVLIPGAGAGLVGVARPGSESVRWLLPPPSFTIFLITGLDWSFKL